MLYPLGSSVPPTSPTGQLISTSLINCTTGLNGMTLLARGSDAGKRYGSAVRDIKANKPMWSTERVKIYSPIAVSDVDQIRMRREKCMREVIS